MVGGSTASIPIKRRAPWRGRKRAADTKEKFIAVRCTLNDHAFIAETASQAGLSVGAFLRTLALGTAGARAVKRPRIEREQLAQLLGEIGKLGSNVNQIARWANTDQQAPSYAELVKMGEHIAAMRAEVMKALDRGDQGRLRCGSRAPCQRILQRTDTNERMEVSELRGVAAKDLRGALQEMEAVAAACPNCRKPLYHASINTRAGERLNDTQRMQAIDRLEKELGLTGQPRVVVVHEKKDRQRHDREHCHVVWSRIDLARLRTISDSHNYRKHELVARELERAFGHERVQGAHIERDGQAAAGADSVPCRDAAGGAHRRQPGGSAGAHHRPLAARRQRRGLSPRRLSIPAGFWRAATGGILWRSIRRAACTALRGASRARRRKTFGRGWPISI